MVRYDIQNQLVDFYRRRGIHPECFQCPHESACRADALPHVMTETKMTMVGSKYGADHPRIVVVSLDPPLGEAGRFSTPHERTTQYVTATHEAEFYAPGAPSRNPHWAMTQIIVKDILMLYGYKPILRHSAVVEERYAGRPIENVSSYFAHVNVAKCSMNNPSKHQAPRSVHERCGHSYLLEELGVLQPDILISQGRVANQLLGRQFVNRPVELDELPKTFRVEIGQSSALWLPMLHPARKLGPIRSQWPCYCDGIREWQGVG